MRTPDLADMNAFIAVAERRSFAKAAAQLGVSRSRLSETIRGLEERLGVRLLNRTTRSVAPTEAGARMLAPLVARFLAQYPEISLEISADAALTDIVAGRFDAGIRPGERIERDMIAMRIGGEVRSIVVAAPDYLARRPRPTTPRDLEVHDCIMFRLPSGAVFSWPFEKKGQRLEAAASGRLTVNDQDVAVRAALDGVGVLYTALAYVAPLIEAGRLVPLLEDWQTRSPALYLYYPSRRQIPAPLQAFIQFLRENLRAR